MAKRKQDSPQIPYTGLIIGCIIGSLVPFMVSRNFNFLAWITGILLGFASMILISIYVLKYRP